MAVKSTSASLTTAMRKLWADHVIWTRQVIVALVASTRDLDATLGRLMANQEHIGNAIVPFYGEEAGKQLTTLLKEHIRIAGELVSAAKAGKQEDFEEQDKMLSQNALDIAEFLGSANPYWPAKDVADLLNTHLLLTKKEAVARLTEKWDVDIEAFDDIFTEIMTVSDTLAGGIIKQFPDRFDDA